MLRAIAIRLISGVVYLVRLLASQGFGRFEVWYGME